MRNTQFFPHSWVKACLNCVGFHWLPVNKGLVNRREMHQVLIRCSQGRLGGWVVCLLSVAIKYIQCFIVSGVTGDILCECGQDGGQRGMTEVPRNEEEGLWVLCLQWACDWVENITSCISISRGGDTHSEHNQPCELPWEVVWPDANS